MTYSHATPPKAPPLGDPPPHLNAAECDAWREMAAMDTGNRLTLQDRLLVELACSLLVRARANGMANLPSTQTLALYRTLGRLRERMQVSEYPWQHG